MYLKAVRTGTVGHLIMFLLIATGQAAFSQPAVPQLHKAKPSVLIASPDNDTLIPSLVNKVAAYSFTIDHNSFLLRRKYNLKKLEVELPKIEKRLKGFKSRIESRGGQMNLLSLNSSIIILGEAADQLSAFHKSLVEYSIQFTKSNAEVINIIKDHDLDLTVADTVLMEQLRDVRKEGLSLDSLQHKTINRLNVMRNRVSVDLLQANDIISDMRYLTISLKMAMLLPEDRPLLSARPADYSQSFPVVAIKGLQLSAKIILIYVNRKWDVISVSLLLFIIITGWCMANIRRLKARVNAAVIFEQAHFLRRSVVAGSLLALFTYSPLFFEDPTISYLHANGLLLVASLTFLIFPFLTRHSKIVWVPICLVWLFHSLDGLLLEPAFGARWGLFVSGLVLSVICIYMLKRKTRIFCMIEESPATKPMLVFVLGLSVTSIVFNLAGNVTLAKIAGISAIQSLVLGISLKVFCTMVLESVYLQSEAYHESRVSKYINYKELQHRFLRVLWILASVVWLAALLRHLTVYDAVTGWCLTFLRKQRSIGNMTYTFVSAAVFIGIIWISSIISGMINFFFNQTKAGVSGRRSIMASMRLLVRLGVWALGFLIAVAAAGVPLDKLSLMIGALGVGIGFGLQSIVNNLVSGVILAFERPVQIGDLIEVGNKKGIVEEISVRSSKIKSSDGAVIIIPNGDLLGQHLINWTMKDRFKRVEFIIGIRYETEILHAKQLIQETLKENKDILVPPEPVVIVQEFTDNAINIRILFWTSEVSQAGTVRSNAMIEIFLALTGAGIQLPYTKQELLLN